MRLLQRCFNFYITSSIHVAMSVSALSWVTLIRFNLAFDVDSLSFIFFAAIVGYNFVKYFEVVRKNDPSYNLKYIQWLSIVAIMIMTVLFFGLKWRMQWVVMLLAIVTFCYATPIFPKDFFRRRQKQLRDIKALKIYVIALVWALTTVILPLQNVGYCIDFEVWLVVLQNFVFILVLMLPFEIRDMFQDSVQLSTIPQQLGVKRTKLLGIALLFMFLGLNFFRGEIRFTRLIIQAVITLMTLFFLVFSKQQQSKYYASFWVESIPIVWLVLLLLLIFC